MGRVEGKVAFITGVARGQGRSHAVRLAEEGADIIGIDICRTVDTAVYQMSTPEDLEETKSLVEGLGRRIIAGIADVRDYSGMKAILDEGVAEFGRLDIVIANAGLGSSIYTAEEMPEDHWNEMIDINLTGVWKTCKASIPHLIDNKGGSIIITGSGAALKAVPNLSHYVSAKHAIVGLSRAIANEQSHNFIRCNTIHPGNVDTPLLMNEALFKLFRPDLEHPTREDIAEISATVTHAIPVAFLEPRDISNAVLFLASDESRYITGAALPVDAGFAIK